MSSEGENMLTNLGTLIASLIPIYFLIRDNVQLISQGNNCGCNWTNKPLPIYVRHGQIHHSTMAIHPSYGKKFESLPLTNKILLAMR